MPERQTPRPMREARRRVEGGIEYLDLEPVKLRDRVVDQILGRVLGFLGVGVAENLPCRPFDHLITFSKIKLKK